jgi:hypothetical protein
MGLRSWLGLRSSRAEALESAFDPIKFSTDTRIPAGFREFTLPPRLQRSGPFTKGSGPGKSYARNPIVPKMGVKVP